MRQFSPREQVELDRKKRSEEWSSVRAKAKSIAVGADIDDPMKMPQSFFEKNELDNVRIGKSLAEQLQEDQEKKEALWTEQTYGIVVI